MWGQRVQPWMQCRSAFYAVGGMAPPLVMQHTGNVQAAAFLCGALCLSTVIGGSLERIQSLLSVHLSYNRDIWVNGAVSGDGMYENVISERTPLKHDSASDRNHNVIENTFPTIYNTTIPDMSAITPTNSTQSGIASTDSISYSRHLVSGGETHVSAGRSLESTELAALEELLSASDQRYCFAESINGGVDVGHCSGHVDDIVSSVLASVGDRDIECSDSSDAATDRSIKRSEGEKRTNRDAGSSAEDPIDILLCGSGGSDVTLAYATAPIVDSLTQLHQQCQRSTGRNIEFNDVGVNAIPSPGVQIQHEQALHNRIVADLAASIALIPDTGKNMLAVFLFLFCTFSASFVGWFPTFCAVKMDEGISVPVGLGAQVVSVYFCFMSWGCIASIPCAVWLPNQTLLRCHLVLIAIGVCVFQISVDGTGVNVKGVLVAAAVMGYGVSSVFPLTMTMANDYGFTADANATTRMLMGGSIGSSLIPMVIGYGMKKWGPEVLTIFVLTLGIGMGFAYMNAHRFLARASAAKRAEAVASAFATSSKPIGVLRNTISVSELERQHVLSST